MIRLNDRVVLWGSFRGEVVGIAYNPLKYDVLVPGMGTAYGVPEEGVEPIMRLVERLAGG